MSATTDRDGQPARFPWLPPAMRPPAPMTHRQERTFLLVGLAALFAGFDQNVYGFAIPQIQAALHIPENRIGLTVTFFRLATFLAMMISASADLVGRRRLLLITIFGQGAFTLATAFSQTYAQFVWLQVATRIFGYAEEMLCVVVIAEEVAAGVRGWANGTLAALLYAGAGLASLCFAFVNVLPGRWRALYVIGGLSILFVAFLRRRLPETKRFEARLDEVVKLHDRIGGALDMLRRLIREYPGRVALIYLISGVAGFAVAPAAVLGNKYLQQTLGYAPWQTTALALPGGFLAIGLNILIGRASDRIGRRFATSVALTLAAVAYALFYSGIQGWPIPLLWVLSYAGYFSSDSLVAGFAVEIVPTAYRATIAGTRYAVGIMMGGISLGLEGVWYDILHAHGPAISVALLVTPIAMAALWFLPEPAGRTLEEMTLPVP